jgi:Transcriptional regulators
MHVARTRLQDEVYERLCDLILNGEIAPGQLITVQALCDAFGVSAMPVREALQRLVAAKALTTISGRSIGIPVLTPERLQDLARVRLAVEGEAAEWAVDHVSDEALSRLEHLIDQMDRAVDEQDVKAFIRSNKDFHFTIYQLSGSDVAYAIIEGLWLQIAPYFHDLYVLDRYVKAGDDHRMVLDGLKTRNRSMVGQGIRSDIEGGSRLLLSMLTASRSPGRSTDTEQPVTS